MKEVKDYLRQVYNIDCDINARLREQDAIRQTMVRASSIQSDKVQESRAGRYDDRYLKLLKLHDDIDDIIDKVAEKRIIISRQIDRVEDDVCRAILRERYLNNLSWEEIAVQMSYHISWVHKLHGKALILFKKANEEAIKSDKDM